MSRIRSASASVLLAADVLVEAAPAKVKALLACCALALVFSAAYAFGSTSHHQSTVYKVKAYDTVWTIAANHYSGDPRAVVYQIAAVNHLHDFLIRPGQKLQLP